MKTLNAGLTYLKEQVQRAPSSPGVYRMLSEGGGCYMWGKRKI